jgi:hypothetical protein
MKIGIGITTTPNRKDYFEKCILNVHHFSNKISELFTFEDKEFKGVAYAKNTCLNALKNNDYIFLFDDDCWPYKVGWEEYFIDCMTPNNHLLFLSAIHQPKQWTRNYKCVSYRECGGVMMAYTKKVVDKVGYMSSEYRKHGFEHAGYSQRIFNAGLNESPYISPTNASDYIYSMDYSEENVKSSLSKEIKIKNYQYNLSLFLKEKNQSDYKKFTP